LYTVYFKEEAVVGGVVYDLDSNVNVCDETGGVADQFREGCYVNSVPGDILSFGGTERPALRVEAGEATVDCRHYVILAKNEISVHWEGVKDEDSWNKIGNSVGVAAAGSGGCERSHF